MNNDFMKAIKNGNTEVVKDFLYHGFLPTEQSILYSIFFCYSDIIKLLLNSNIIINNDKILIAAIKTENINIVKIVMENKKIKTSVNNNSVILNAIYSNNKEIIDFFWSFETVKYELKINFKNIYKKLHNKEISKKIISF